MHSLAFQLLVAEEIQRAEAVEGRREPIERALMDTFRRRAAHPVPSDLGTPPDFWKPVFKNLAAE